MFFNKKKILGLDIGSTSIKIVEVEGSARGGRLTAFGMAVTPPRTITGGEISDTQAVGSVIRSLVSSIHSKRDLVATGLWGGSVIVKRISMPRMDDKLLAEQVKWEAEQYIPFNIEEVSLEYSKLKSNNPISESIDVLVVAAKTDLIYKYIETMQIAGLQCKIMDVSCLALANCFESNYGRLQGTVALLNIGASVTNFVVLDGGQVAFTRDIPIGGDLFTQDLKNEMGVSVEEAEALKINASRTQQVPEDVTRIIASSTETLAQEIRASFEFYTSGSQNTISRFFATGGSVSIPRLVSQISKAVNTPGEVLDPLRNIQASSRQFSFDYLQQIKPFASIAIGLGLRKESEA